MPDTIPPPPAGYTVVPPPPKGYTLGNKAPTPVTARAVAPQPTVKATPPPPPPGFKINLNAGTTPAASTPQNAGPIGLVTGAAGAVWDIVAGAATMLFKSAQSALNDHTDEAQPGSLQGMAEHTIPDTLKTAWAIGSSLPIPLNNVHQSFSPDQTRIAIASTQAGIAAAKGFMDKWKQDPWTATGRASVNITANFIPYGWFQKLAVGAKVTEGFEAASAATAAERLSMKPVMAAYAASDEFAQGVTNATGRGATSTSVPARHWEIKPDFKPEQPGVHNTWRGNWPPRLRTQGTVTQVLPRARILKPAPHEGVTPSYGFMNPLRQINVSTEAGDTVRFSGPVADMVKGGGVVLTKPIQLKDGATIEQPVLSGLGIWDGEKGTQTTDDVAQQVRDLLQGKPQNNVRAFHPDLPTQDMLQRSIDIINGTDSIAFAVHPSMFNFGESKLPMIAGALTGSGKVATLVEQHVVSGWRQAQETAVYEGAKRLDAEHTAERIMRSEIKTKTDAKFASFGTNGTAVGEFIRRKGASDAEVSPEAVGARHARAMFDVNHGVMRSMGMNLGYKDNYLPVIVEEGHLAVNSALAKARVIDGPMYVPDILKEAGLSDTQIAEAKTMKGDPNQVIAQMIEKYSGLTDEQAADKISELHAKLDQRVIAQYIPDATEHQTTLGMQRSGAHGITLTLDHVLHQGSTWEGIEALAKKTNTKLTPIKDVSELLARQFSNIARNVRQARLVQVLKNAQVMQTRQTPGLVDLQVGTKTVYVPKRVKEFINRVIPQNDHDGLSLLRGASAIAKEGTVGWNISIHAKTLSTGVAALLPWSKAGSALEDMMHAAHQMDAFGPVLYEAANAGLNIDHMTRQYGSIFTQIGKWTDENIPGPLAKIPGGIGALHDKMHELLFDKYACMLALGSYMSLKKHFVESGMSESMARRSAADFVNDVLGIPSAADVPTWLNKYGYLAFFAAQFKLGSVRSMGKALGGFLPAAATQAERAVQLHTAWSMNVRAAAIQMFLTNAMQYALTRTYSYNNPPGHFFDIATGTRGTTPGGKSEPIYVRLKDFNTDPEVLFDKLAGGIQASKAKGKSSDVSAIPLELYTLAGPMVKTGGDVMDAAWQHKFDTEFIKSESLDLVTPSWLQSILKQTGEYPLKSFEAKVPAEDLWLVAAGFSPFGSAPPKHPSLNMQGPSMKGLTGP